MIRLSSISFVLLLLGLASACGNDASNAQPDAGRDASAAGDAASGHDAASQADAEAVADAEAPADADVPADGSTLADAALDAEPSGDAGATTVAALAGRWDVESISPDGTAVIARDGVDSRALGAMQISQSSPTEGLFSISFGVLDSFNVLTGAPISATNVPLVLDEDGARIVIGGNTVFEITVTSTTLAFVHDDDDVRDTVTDPVPARLSFVRATSPVTALNGVWSLVSARIFGVTFGPSYCSDVGGSYNVLAQSIHLDPLLAMSTEQTVTEYSNDTCTMLDGTPSTSSFDGLRVVGESDVELFLHSETAGAYYGRYTYAPGTVDGTIELELDECAPDDCPYVMPAAMVWARPI